MNNSQSLSGATLTGAPTGTSPSNLNPGSPGVTFNQPNASITIPFAPGITPILVEVSIPNTNTNVNQTHVIITAPNGTIIANQVSPPGSNVVTGFPVTPLPANSTVTITFQTNNGQPPANVTISEIACYTPSSTTTIVTSGTAPPTVTGSTPTFTISSSTSVVATGTGKKI